MIQILASCSSPALGAALSAFKKILGIIQIIVPILLMVGLAIHIIQLVHNPDDQKRKKKALNSVIAAVIVFFVPMFIDVVMGMVGDSFTVSACWNSINNPGSSTSYVDPYDQGSKTGFIVDPSDYEKGKPKPASDYPGGGSSPTDPGGTGSVPVSSQEYKGIVWDSSNVTRKSNLTTAQLIAILNAHGGKAKNFIPYAQNLIAAEQKYSVNVFFLIGVEALESGWITSNISKKCNNLGGVRESKNHPSNGCGRNAGGGFAYFNSVPEFIDYHAYMLHTNYLTPSGKYYEGTSPYGVVVHYCGNSSSWPVSVIRIGNSLFKHVPQVVG